MKEESYGNLNGSSQSRVGDESSRGVPQKKSVVLLVVLSIITFGIYGFVWYIKRAPEFNNLQTENKFSKKMAVVALVSYILYYVLFIIFGLIIFVMYKSLLTSNQGNLESLMSVIVSLLLILILGMIVINIVSLIYTILAIVMAFKTRTILNQTLENKGVTRKVSILFTLFFNLFYLQYEINRMIDDREEEKRLGPWIVLGIYLGFMLLAFLANMIFWITSSVA